MKKLACVATKIVGNLSGTLNLYIQLKSSWHKIIGKELENFLTISNIRYTGKDELTIFIKILSSALLIVKHNSDKISKSISNLLGISNIKLVFQHTSVLAPSSGTKVCLNETQKIQNQKTKEVINTSFKSETLKNALERLKTEIQNAA